MKKSTPTPKELAKKRLYNGKLMKISRQEFNPIDKENVRPDTEFVSKFKLIVHDREVPDHGPRNPYTIPRHMRTFLRKTNKRKVKPEPFIMSEPFTICDIDSTFYKIIEGRPLRHFCDVKVYMKNIRDITIFRANAAYLKEQIVQIESNFAYELEKYKEIDTLYLKCKDNFVQFAKESYDKGQKAQILAEEKARELDAMVDKLEALSFEYVKLRNGLSDIGVIFETLSKYRQFLYMLSPVWWGEKHDQDITKVEIFFRKLSTHAMAASNISLEPAKIIIESPVQLYFKKPKQLMHIFDDMGRQCLNYMQINVLTNNTILTPVLKGRDYLRALMKKEVSEMQDFVEIFEKHISWLEFKETEYKTIFDNLLMKEFQKLYASYEVTKLYTCVQYTHTRIFGGPEDPKDSVKTLMQRLEGLYFELTLGLDSLDQGIVHKATKQFFSEDIKMMKMAHLAQRTLKECDILKKALYNSFQPPKCKPKRK